MDESILLTIKKMLGPDADYDVFDLDIRIHINSALSVLTQLGVGPAEGFRITGPDETWGDFLGAETKGLDFVKTYVYMKVRLLFDPPTNGSAQSAYQDMCKELEWRMNVIVDPGKAEENP